MDADSSDSGEERFMTDVFNEMHRKEDTPASLSLPPSRAVPSVATKASSETPSKKVDPKRDPIVDLEVEPLAEAALVALPKPMPPLHVPAPLPKLGDWWLTRTNRVSRSCPCGVKINEYECRLIYCVYKPELAKKAPSYAAMHSKIGWAYHHVNYKCLPAPSQSAQIEEVTGRDSIFVEIAALPKRFDESSAQLLSTTNAAVRDALREFRLAGHNVDLGAYK